MKIQTSEDAKAWTEIYENSGFGNKYPSSYLVSLYHHFIKKLVPKTDGSIKALDFGCSFGANARMLQENGADVYGIDIAPAAIKYCIEEQKLDREKFITANVLDGFFSIEKLFGKFDLIIASQCLYYFSASDLKKLLQIFQGCLKAEGGYFMPAW